MKRQNTYEGDQQHQLLSKVLLDTINEGFVLLNEEYKIIDCNQYICKLLCIDDIVSISITEFLSDDSKIVFQNLRNDLIVKKTNEYSISLLDSDKHTIPCKITEVLIDNHSNIEAYSLLMISENVHFQELEKESQTGTNDINELSTKCKSLEQTVESLQNSMMELEVSQDNALFELSISQNEIIEQRDNLEVALNDLKNAENKISSIIHCMPDAVLVVDKNGIVVAWNMAMEKLTGIKAADMLGKGDYEYAVPFYGTKRKILVDLMFEADEILMNSYLNISHDGEIIRGEIFTSLLGNEGLYLQGSASALNDMNENVIGAIEIIRDITARVKADEKILEQQKEMATINVELRQTMEELTTQRDMLADKTTMLAETLDQLEKSQHKLVESAKMVALGQLIAGVAHEINTPLGAIRSSVTNISESLENILSSLPNFFDLLDNNDKKHFNSLLDRSIKSKITITSKEERTFKRTILSMLDNEGINQADDYADTLVDMGIYDGIEELIPFLKSGKSDDVLQMAYKVSGVLRSSRTINIAIERASKIVFALKNFTHFNQTGEMVKANIIESLEIVLTLYYNQIKQGVALIKRFDEGIIDIMCFPDELNQVWTNLIYNALQAMQNSGTLEVDISKNGNTVVVAITDSGCGIPEEIKDKIFMPFFTTKPQGEGSGLGLDIVKRIIEKHFGQIQFESVPGRTTFKVTLPINI